MPAVWAPVGSTEAGETGDVPQVQQRQMGHTEETLGGVTVCLDTVDKEPKVTEGVGWKLYTGEDRNDRPDPKRGLPPWMFGSTSPIGEWVKDTSSLTVLHIPGSCSYPCGFHLFLTEKDARVWNDGDRTRVRKVSFRSVVATGTVRHAGRQLPAIVAREIYIHPKER